ncbi:MAG: ABC transporter ATP-binding protein [Wenzhouxiangellaceae bacterium]|nr:ABC transporter ATP-binding protein [Wenzhouxiangellaceae bacterium]
MIELERVSFAYPEGAAVLDSLSFGLQPGERAVLLGANGCGKSTLLKLVNGLHLPVSGTFRFEGRAVDERALREPEFRRRFRQAIGLVFQHPEAMLFNATVAEEIAWGPSRLGLPEPETIARDWADTLGLVEQLDQAPYRLSGGQKQRLALACVLAVSPRLLLLDEPTANLDPRATGWLIDFLAATPELATLTTTQNLALARELGTRALVLSEQGRLLFDGPLDDALADLDLLVQANLAHRHRHRHGADTEHSHPHGHADWS